MCILPFHETPQFAKMASLLKFNQGNIWEFIRHLRRPIRPLLREQLVSQCLREPALLRALSRMLMMAVENGTAHKTLYTFYTATVIRTLQRMPHVNDHMMTILLPMIVDALKQDDHDYRLLAMIVLSQLAERVTFSVDALGELLLAVAVPMPKCEASHVMEIALCLLHLSRQENIEEAFGEALVEVLGSTPNFIQVTLKSCAETYDLSSFIWPWLKQLLNMSSSMHWMMVDELINTLPLSSSMVERIVRLVLEMAAKRQGDVQGLQQCLNRLRLLYADQVSHLVNDTLKSYHANRQLYTALYDFLASSLKGTDIQVIGDTPLFLALNHADVDKRKVALCELSEIMKKKSGELDAAFVEQALLDRLHQEEDEELIRMTLSLELGQWIRQDRLLDALERLMRTEDRLRLNAAQCMLTQLTLDASSVERVLHTILPCLLACGSSETTIAFADMVLASPLGQLPWLASFSQIKCEFEAMLKRDAFVNASIVYHRQLMEMLASVVASSSLVHVLETYLTSGHDRASLMALLILSESVNKRQGEEQVKFAKQCVDMLAGWLRRCVGRTWSASAQALNQRLVERPLDEVQRELYAVLVSSTPVSDMLLATLVYVMRTVVERIPVPTSSDHDWQDTVYASVLRTLFLNIVQEKDTRPFDVVIKIIFSKHLVHKTLAFLSTIWTRQGRWRVFNRRMAFTDLRRLSIFGSIQEFGYRSCLFGKCASAEEIG
jgi:U3 small nucleolar RNA-associated protein 10